jgi:competence protein ComEC
MHFLVCYILGVLLEHYFSFINNRFNIVFIGICLFTVFFLFLKKRKLISILSFFLFFSIGIISSFINDDKNSSSYYEKHESSNQTIYFRITKILKSTNYYNKFEAEVIQLNDKKTKGKILVNIRKDKLAKKVTIGNIVVTKTNFVSIPKPKNPNQFSYKNYLANQQIYKQLFLTKDQFSIQVDNKFSLNKLVEKSKNAIKNKLNNYSFSKDELSILYALFLGEKQYISQELKNNYSKAGVIHILAISGLHIGILLIIFLFLLKPLEYLKHGLIYKLVFTILLLWLFAFFTGLSASVVRAVTMYSFVAVGQLFNKRTPTYFSLISSMLFLLLVNPLYIFDVGFQLSYSAVFAIVWIQPTLSKFYQPKQKILKYFWDLITVSVSAQFGVLPLSIFYFNQFPGLFLIANLVVIPTLFILLILGIFTITTSFIVQLPEIFINPFRKLISTLNSFINWIGNQDAFLFKKLHISSSTLITLYLIIIASVLILKGRTIRRFAFLCIGIISFQIFFIIENYQRNNTKELLVFYKNKTSIIAKREGSEIKTNLDTNSLREEYATTSYINSSKISKINGKTIENFFLIDRQPVLIIDSLGIYFINNVKEPIVILQHSPKINLERMIKTLNPKLIIANGSNYKSYIEHWQKSSKTLKTPFYNVFEKGAFIYKF